MIPCNAPGIGGPADSDESDLYADFDARVRELRQEGMTLGAALARAENEQEQEWQRTTGALWQKWRAV